MSPRTLVSRLVLLVGLSTVGCVHSAGTRLEQDTKAARAERDPNKLLDYAMSFRETGDLTRAEQYLNAALEAGAEERKVFPLLLGICVADKRYRSAINYTEDYLRRHPRDQKLRFVLATLYSALEDHQHAKSELSRVIANDPGQADAHYMLGVILRDHFADFQGSDAHFREYLRLEPQGQHEEEAQGSLLSRIE
jgi:Tfp pilus assembly protein PilF